MSETTGIAWCDSTFNPWIGCTKVGPGCDNCYAKADFDDRKHRVVWGAGQERSRTKTWGDPKKWNSQHAAFFAEHGRRRRVFCASLADVFDNEVPVQWRADLLQLIDLTPNLDWLLLTKRIGNVVPMLKDIRRAAGGTFAFDLWPRPNVWLGATVVNQEEADRDIPKLLAVPALVRFLSIEPMLGPIDLTSIGRYTNGSLNIDSLRGIETRGQLAMSPNEGAMCVSSSFGNPHLSWVICGGESGRSARPMHPGWARSLRDQCAAAGVPFLFKQWGEWIGADQDGCPCGPPASRWQWGDGTQFIYGEKGGPFPLLCRAGKKAAGRLLDGRTHDGFPA